PVSPNNRVRIVVASSVMLTFISWWRAAAIVLNDMGSSAFYAPATAEQAVGKAAPWFVLGVMLFSFGVRSVYGESCSMSVWGGVPKACHLRFGAAAQVTANVTAVVIAIRVTLDFWWENIKGIEEASDKALKVMQITTVMVVLLLGWAAFTLLRHPQPLPPWPVPGNLHFTKESLGFIKNPELPRLFGIFGIMMAFGHSILAMSG